MKLHPLQLESIVKTALLEDLGQGDLTTDFHEAFSHRQASYHLEARQEGVLSGVDVANAVVQAVDPTLKLQWHLQDGEAFPAKRVLAHLHGTVASILKAERTLLNFVQHLSGVATQTRRFATALEGTGVKVTDTRKTTPGLRLLEKKAVLDGGGSPHRYNLGSAAMIKDNHIAVIRQSLCGETTTAQAIRSLREALPHTARLEVEVDCLQDIPDAVDGGADIILLDNFTPEQVKEAVSLIESRSIEKKVMIEVSGGVTLQTIRSLALPGVGYISTSQITVGALPLDIGLDAQPAV